MQRSTCFASEVLGGEREAAENQDRQMIEVEKYPSQPEHAAASQCSSTGSSQSHTRTSAFLHRASDAVPPRPPEAAPARGRPGSEGSAVSLTAPMLSRIVTTSRARPERKESSCVCGAAGGFGWAGWPSWAR